MLLNAHKKIHSTYFKVLNNMVTKNSGEKNLNSRYFKVSELFFPPVVLIFKKHLLINCEMNVTSWHCHALATI